MCRRFPSLDRCRALRVAVGLSSSRAAAAGADARVIKRMFHLNTDNNTGI